MKLAVFIAGVVCAPGLGQVTLTPLGSPAGVSSVGVFGATLSRDGRVVTAQSPFAGFRSWWWDESSGYEEHQSPNWINVSSSITPDGGIAVGFMQPDTSTLAPSWAFRRVRGSEAPERLVGMARALGVSDDGRTVVGHDMNDRRTLVWRDGTLTDLGAGSYSGGAAISGDGRTIAGWNFIWREGLGSIDLPGTLGLAATPDGSAVFGFLNENPLSVLSSGFFRWTESGGVEDLGRPAWVPPGVLPSSLKRVFATDDGGLALFTGFGEPTLWSRELGFERVRPLLEQAGVSYPNQGVSITGLSGDGRVMLINVGLGGQVMPYLVTLPAPGSAAVLAGAMVFAARRRR